MFTELLAKEIVDYAQGRTPDHELRSMASHKKDCVVCRRGASTSGTSKKSKTTLSCTRCKKPMHRRCFDLYHTIAGLPTKKKQEES